MEARDGDAEAQSCHLGKPSGRARRCTPNASRCHCLWVYVERQNNVLFSALAHFFGPEAINGEDCLEKGFG